MANERSNDSSSPDKSSVPATSSPPRIQQPAPPALGTKKGSGQHSNSKGDAGVTKNGTAVINVDEPQLPVQHALTFDITSTLSFAPFNAQTVSEPYDEDARKDAEYDQKVTRAILELALDFTAWARSRPAYETRMVGNALSDEVNAIAVDEQRQDQLRLQIAQFVNNIRSAAQALSSFANFGMS